MENPTFHLYGNIGQPDEFLKALEGIADNVSSQKLNDFLQANLDASALTIVINSDGGEVNEGFAMYDAIKRHPATITTVAKKANSIASVVFLAGENRLIAKDVEFMVHNAWLSGDVLKGITLNTHDFAELQKITDEVDASIKGVYSKFIKNGADISSLMQNETYISADELIEMGFATGIADQVPADFMAKTRPLTYTKQYLSILNKSKQNKMAEDVNKRLDGFEGLLKGVLNLFKGSVKNMAVKLADGKELYIFSEDGEIEGKRVVFADPEGNPTDEAAPDGTHELEDGRMINVADGVVEGVQVAESIEDLKAEMEKKEEGYKAELTEKEDEIKALKSKTADLESKVTEIAEAFKALKEAVPGETKPRAFAAKEFTKDEFAKLPASEKIRLNSIIEFQNKKQ